MARLVLKPRATSIVSTSQTNATDVTRVSTKNVASRAIAQQTFTAEDVDNGTLHEKLGTLQKEVTEELAAIRSFPFTRGVLFKDVAFPGVMGQVMSFSGAYVWLWRDYDCYNFRQGQVIKASATNGKVYGSLRAGSVTLNNDGFLDGIGTGTVQATANWTAGIAALANGDYLFLVETINGVATNRYQTCTKKIQHGLGVTPTGYWIVKTSRGASPPELAVRSADSEQITFDSSVAATADIFIAG